MGLCIFDFRKMLFEFIHKHVLLDIKQKDYSEALELTTVAHSFQSLPQFLSHEAAWSISSLPGWVAICIVHHRSHTVYYV